MRSQLSTARSTTSWTNGGSGTFFARLAERSGGTARLHLQDAVADDWFAVAPVEVAGRAGGETLDGERAVLVVRVHDARFVELWSHHDDQHKMNRAWS